MVCERAHQDHDCDMTRRRMARHGWLELTRGAARLEDLSLADKSICVLLCRHDERDESRKEKGRNIPGLMGMKIESPGSPLLDAALSLISHVGTRPVSGSKVGPLPSPRCVLGKAYQVRRPLTVYDTYSDIL